MDASLLRSSFKAASSLSARRQPLPRSTCTRCLLHTSATNAATPVAHRTVAGPPPSAPLPAASSTQDRLARKHQKLEQYRQNQQTKVNPAKPQTALQKRFWKDVSVQEVADGNLQIHLDTRPVRTAQRQVLTLPKHKRALAASIAIEWDHLVSAQQALKHHYVPMTSMTSRALDIEAADAESNTTIREQLAKMLLRYLGTDTLLCWAPEKNLHDPDQADKAQPSLRLKQIAAAEPILAYLTTHIFPGVEIVPVLGEDSIMPSPQPELTREVIRGWISGLPAYELAALERGVLATKSLLIAARLLVEWSGVWGHLREREGRSEERFGIEEAAEAATLEVLHQTRQWGEVEDTHDVEKEDLRRQLGSVVLFVS